jgi:membrane-bound lytic murein transglycosylase F
LTKKIFILLILIATATAGLVYRKYSHAKIPDVRAIDLDGIRKRGKLIAVTDFNSTDYFIYKGTPMGFNYEMLNSFSDFAGIDLEIIAQNDIHRATEMVLNGEADLLASGLTGTETVVPALKLSSPIDRTSDVLVQRKYGSPGTLSALTGDQDVIRDLNKLRNKVVYVQEGARHEKGIAEIIKATGGEVNIISVPFNPEKLIQLVAAGEIDYTICDENLATVNSTYYTGIDAKTIISQPFDISWCVRNENSSLLLEELNRWIDSYRHTDSYSLLHAKYFNNSWSSSIVRSDYFSLNTGKVSMYDDLIRKFSPSIEWDWRLLASLICQESQFRPNVVSVTGAYGLMQIMPVTGRNFGIDIKASPENNIKAGILYITWLNTIFETRISDRQERLNFILAAYNAGPGHILDAMRLAEKNGMDPLKWDGSVALWLERKSEPLYYTDSVVKSGYYRGIESVKFVTEVLGRFEHYKNIIPEEKSRPYGE